MTLSSALETDETGERQKRQKRQKRRERRDRRARWVSLVHVICWARREACVHPKCCGLSERYVRGNAQGEESGMAIVEFIGVVVALVIPVLYIIVALAQAHAATVAAESAATASARYFAMNSQSDGVEKVQHSISKLSFSDQGLDADNQVLELTTQCLQTCDSAGATVVTAVTYSYQLPLLGWLPVSTVRIEAKGTSYIGQLEATQ